MSKNELASIYLNIISNLPLPGNPEVQKSFCHDRDTALTIIGELQTSDLPSLELFEKLIRLEFLIAKNSFATAVVSFQAAVSHAQTIREQLVAQNPELDAEIKSKKKPHLDLVDQIAQEVFTPDPTDQKSRNRYRFIQQSASQIAKSHEASQSSQLKFRELYSRYTTTKSTR